MGIDLNNFFDDKLEKKDKKIELNLSKLNEKENNNLLDLTKINKGLEKVIIGTGFKNYDNNTSKYDLDLALFLLNSNGKIQNVNTDVVYFNNTESLGITLDNNIKEISDNNEIKRIIIDFDKIPENIEKIICNVTVFEAKKRKQIFGMIKESYIRLFDIVKNIDLINFKLSENVATSTSFNFIEFFKDKNEWKFNLLLNGKIADLNDILKLYT
ncbi:TerD family protein [Clostridium thermobutyricum]|uniref:TerD family protein n=1 Tax=Clostridium thermobutyricum TaxID=29372 RepID=UPI002942695A|nr:TerD family protein [Clostridium thermobutyricum]